MTISINLWEEEEKENFTFYSKLLEAFQRSSEKKFECEDLRARV